MDKGTRNTLIFIGALLLLLIVAILVVVSTGQIERLKEIG